MNTSYHNVNVKKRGREVIEVDGVKYTFCQLATTEGLRVGLKLKKSFMKPLVQIIPGVAEADVGGGSTKEIADKISQFLVENNKVAIVLSWLEQFDSVIDYVEILMKSVRDENGEVIEYDEYWSINSHYLNVLIAAYTHNFREFFFLTISLILQKLAV